MHRHYGADGILVDIKGKFTTWKPNASCLSSNLLVNVVVLISGKK